MPEVPTPPTPDVTERTTLAGERTLLAWWRTGLAAVAVSIGVGRIVPELSDSGTQWPYTVLGVAFALYGIALIMFGTARGRSVQAAAHEGRVSITSEQTVLWLTAAGVVLSLGAAVVVVVD